eukprot:COSAG05_NODE_3583_length_1979_cov_6.405851_3_plen_93_part_00
MNAYVVLVDGHVYGVFTSPVDAHIIAKPLNARVEQCRLNAVVEKVERPQCAHVWDIESVYGTKSEKICKKCDCYLSDLSPDFVISTGGSGHF